MFLFSDDEEDWVVLVLVFMLGIERIWNVTRGVWGEVDGLSWRDSCADIVMWLFLISDLIWWNKSDLIGEFNEFWVPNIYTCFSSERVFWRTWSMCVEFGEIAGVDSRRVWKEFAFGVVVFPLEWNLRRIFKQSSNCLANAWNCSYHKFLIILNYAFFKLLGAKYNQLIPYGCQEYVLYQNRKVTNGQSTLLIEYCMIYLNDENSKLTEVLFEMSRVWSFFQKDCIQYWKKPKPHQAILIH